MYTTVGLPGIVLSLLGLARLIVEPDCTVRLRVYCLLFCGMYAVCRLLTLNTNMTDGSSDDGWVAKAIETV